MERYAQKVNAPRPLNILLAAGPGSGKSFLIKQLIGAIDAKAQFEELYIASLDSVAEIYHMFQRVQSINLEGKMPVVFFDEIDAALPVDVYAKFLSPMWEGYFYLGKDKYHLGRAIFFFAGSGIGKEAEWIKMLSSAEGTSYDVSYAKWRVEFDKQLRKGSTTSGKLADFLDRIDKVLRIPGAPEKFLSPEDAELEYEDMACILINKHFEDVTFVGAYALELIVKLLKNSRSVREAEKLVFSSHLGGSREPFDFFSFPEHYRESCKPDVKRLGDKEELDYYQIIGLEKPRK